MIKKNPVLSVFERTVISLKYDNIITFNGHEFAQIPGGGNTEKLGVLQSMGSQRVGHD